MTTIGLVVAIILFLVLAIVGGATIGKRRLLRSAGYRVSNENKQ
jgi:hypothetical protein